LLLKIVENKRLKTIKKDTKITTHISYSERRELTNGEDNSNMDDF